MKMRVIASHICEHRNKHDVQCRRLATKRWVAPLGTLARWLCTFHYNRAYKP